MGSETPPPTGSSERPPARACGTWVCIPSRAPRQRGAAVQADPLLTADQAAAQGPQATSHPGIHLELRRGQGCAAPWWRVDGRQAPREPGVGRSLSHLPPLGRASCRGGPRGAQPCPGPGCQWAAMTMARPWAAWGPREDQAPRTKLFLAPILPGPPARLPSARLQPGPPSPPLLPPPLRVRLPWRHPGDTRGRGRRPPATSCASSTRGSGDRAGGQPGSVALRNDGPGPGGGGSPCA